MPADRPRPRDPEFWIAIGALAVSAIAMLSSVLQFTVQRSQERAAAWPFISLNTAYSSEGFAFVVQNKGMGPALVRRVDVFLDGRPVEGWPGVLDGLYGPGHPYGWDRIGATDVEDRVFAPGERVEAFSIPWRAPGGEGASLARTIRVCARASAMPAASPSVSATARCWATAGSPARASTTRRSMPAPPARCRPEPRRRRSVSRTPPRPTKPPSGGFFVERIVRPEAYLIFASL